MPNTNKTYTRTLSWHEDHGYFVQINNQIYPLDDKCLTVQLPATLYALPNNEAKPVNTQIKLTTVVDLSKVLMYWGKFPIGLSVEGYINSQDKFVI